MNKFSIKDLSVYDRPDAISVKLNVLQGMTPGVIVEFIDYKISIIWHQYAHCSRKSLGYFPTNEIDPVEQFAECEDAEIAIMDNLGLLVFPNGDTVAGYVSYSDVMYILDKLNDGKITHGRDRILRGADWL